MLSFPRRTSAWAILCLGVCALTIGDCRVARAAPEPGVSGALSLIPGLGQAANGDIWEGAGWLGSTVALMFSRNDYLSQIGFDIWLYNMYDAYRDAGAKQTTPYTLLENWSANFNPLNVADPVGAPIIAAGAIGGMPGHYPTFRKPGRLLTYTFVGLGEEGFFRGFLFPGFSDLLGSQLAGAFVSSVAFAYAHGVNGRDEIRLGVVSQRTLLGMLFCLQAYWNHFDLRKNIFAHSWFDILVDRRGNVAGGSFTVPF